MKKYKFIIFLILIAALFLSCEKKTEEYSRAEFVLGTVCRVRILETKPKKEIDKVLNIIFAELEKLDNIFNANSGFSELEEVNKNAGIKSVTVSDELYGLVKLSIDFAQKTKGAFDPAIGPLVKLWNIGFDSAKEPSANDINAVLPLLNYKDIYLKDKNKIFLKQRNMRLDLGGIAKGYAADKVIKILKENKIQNALIDFGGNIIALGKNPKGTEWQIGLKNPNIGKTNSVITISLKNKSLVTSGNYERFFKKDGIIYHHILDKKTGYPVQTNVNAVSIAADSSANADALSTSCYILGAEKSKELLKNFNDVTAFFFYDDNSILILGKKDIDYSLTDNVFFIKSTTPTQASGY